MQRRGGSSAASEGYKRQVENIGARRLYTVIERVFEELSFSAPDRSGEEIVVNSAFVETNLGELAKSMDVSRYVL